MYICIVCASIYICLINTTQFMVMELAAATSAAGLMAGVDRRL